MNKLIVTLWAVLPVCLCAEVRYTVVPLVPKEVGMFGSYPSGINQRGDVAGSFGDAGNGVHVFTYTDRQGFTDLERV